MNMYANLFITRIMRALVCIAMVASLASGFASVQSAWGACNALTGSASKCLCDPENFGSRLPFAMLADASMLFTYTGRRDCELNMTWLHGSADNDFLHFVGFLYQFGKLMNDTELQEGALWMSVDPVLDGVTLWSQNNGGIEGKGFSLDQLFASILPMASGLDSFIYWNSSCQFNEIVGRTLPEKTVSKILAAARWAGYTVPSEPQFLACINAWQTEGIAAWMNSFVLPIPSNSGLQQFQKNVRFSPPTTEAALQMYEAAVECSLQVFRAFSTSISSCTLAESPKACTENASSQAYTVLASLMQAGRCGAPPEVVVSPFASVQ